MAEERGRVEGQDGGFECVPPASQELSTCLNLYLQSCDNTSEMVLKTRHTAQGEQEIFKIEKRLAPHFIHGVLFLTLHNVIFLHQVNSNGYSTPAPELLFVLTRSLFFQYSAKYITSVLQ